MEGSGRVYFKVYFLGKFNSQEVRRFAISSDIGVTYVILHHKLQTVFPELHHGPFAIYWKDNENDEVRIGCDEELKIALSSMEEPLKKFYIKMLPDNPPEADFSDFAHAGKICDNCTGIVKGFRYKCLQCQNYDLCGSCEAKHCHSHHIMIRLPENIPVKGYDKFWKKINILSSYFDKAVPAKPAQSSERAQAPERAPILQRSPIIERSPLSERSRIMSRIPSKERSPIAEASPATERSHMPERVLPSRSDNICGSRTKKIKIKPIKAEAIVEGARSDEEEGEKKPLKIEVPSCSQMIKDFVQNYEFFVNPGTNGTEIVTGIRAKNPNDPFAKQFEVIGNAVASIVNPFAILMGKNPQPGDKEKEDKEKEDKEKEEKDKEEKDKEDKDKEEKDKEEKENIIPEADPAADAQSQTQSQAQSQTQNKKSFKACAGFGAAFNIEELAKQLAAHHYQCRNADFGKDYVQEFNKELAAQNEGKDKVEDPVELDNEGGGFVQPCSEQGSESEKIYPRVPEDPSIAVALSQMLSMGFSNEGDWLLNLLESKHGDIIKVLEYLERAKK